MLRARHPLTLLAAAAAAAATGCGGDAPAPPGGTGGATDAAADGSPAPEAAICGPVRVTTLGKVGVAAATELSGLAMSPDQRGVLWTHNDSGDRPRVFALRPDGAPLADLDVPGAQAIDWEDLAIGPQPGGGRALYLADIGDNDAVRPTIDLYRVPEPRVPASGATAPAARLRLRYPDGAHNAETLLVEPGTGEIAIVTKRLSGESGVYVTGRWGSSSGATRTLRRVASLSFGLGGLATGGDVSADRRIVVVRAYTGFFAWRKRPSATLAATLRRRPCRGRTSFPDEGQGETLALTANGRAFLTVPEGAAATIRRYAVRG